MEASRADQKGRAHRVRNNLRQGLGLAWAASPQSLIRLDVRGERVQDPITREITGAGRSVRRGIDGSVEIPVGRRLRVTATGTVNDANISETLGGADARGRRNSSVRDLQVLPA